jgi:hydrogenase maturation protease
MDTPKVRCLILGCGNTLRGDDGMGPSLCAWAEERFAEEPGVRAISCQQWTPDLAEDLAAADAVVFVDCALDQAPGQMLVREIAPASIQPGLVTHHLSAPELLRVAEEFYSRRPGRACLLTVGAGSIDVGEQLSPEMEAALPDAQALLESTVRQLLG